jgi:hypothetical protein
VETHFEDARQELEKARDEAELYRHRARKEVQEQREMVGMFNQKEKNVQQAAQQKGKNATTNQISISTAKKLVTNIM